MQAPGKHHVNSWEAVRKCLECTKFLENKRWILKRKKKLKSTEWIPRKQWENSWKRTEKFLEKKQGSLQKAWEEGTKKQPKYSWKAEDEIAHKVTKRKPEKHL